MKVKIIFDPILNGKRWYASWAESDAANHRTIKRHYIGRIIRGGRALERELAVFLAELKSKHRIIP